MVLIGVLGPSKFKSSKKIEIAANNIVETLSSAKFDILISPDKQSTAEFIANKAKDKIKIIGINYQDDTDNDYKGLNRELCDELIDVKTWENQPKELIKRADSLIILGLGVGVVWEICLTKFYRKEKCKVIILTDVTTEKLPKSLNQELPIIYTTSDKLKEHLAELNE